MTGVLALLTRAAASRAVRLALTAAILAYLATRIDMVESARAVARIDIRYLGVVLLLVGADRVVMIFRWILLLRATGTRVPARTTARIFLVSSFVGSFLPAGVGGDAARAWGLTQHTSRGADAVASVAVDRLLGVLSLVVMASAGLLIWTPAAVSSASAAAVPSMVPAASSSAASAPSAAASSVASAAVAVLAAVACAAAFWMDRLIRLVVGAGPHGSIGRRALALADAVGRYRGHRGVLAHVMAWSLAVQLLRITQAYLLGRGLGIDVPYTYYLLVMPIGLLMLLLPVSVSGFGVPQGVIVWLLAPVGVPSETAFALSTLIVLTGLAGNLPGLWLWVGNRRERLAGAG